MSVPNSTPTRPTTSVSTTELYNRWSTIYDTDGNILQALDDTLLPSLLTSALTQISSTTSTTLRPLTITELGAGTGRNTVKLLDPSLPVDVGRVIALDLSEGMLDLAKERCGKYLDSMPVGNKEPEIDFLIFDALSPPRLPTVYNQADLVLSTLVLEHLPLPTFFHTVTTLLKPTGGILILTNMHSEMGRISQAGFWDEDSGVKVRGESYVYEVEEVAKEGRRCGFEVVGEVMERGVAEEDLRKGRGVLGPRGRKWVGVRCWFGCVMRFVGEKESLGRR